MLLLSIIGISAANLHGQTSEDIYVIGTSFSHSGYGWITGFNRLTGKMSDSYITPPITFIITSAEKDFYIDINHYNRSGSPRVILDLPISQLDSFDAIDVAEFIATKTKEQAKEWTYSGFYKTVWIIDRNDFYKSSPSLSAPDRMKLIEARISLRNFPEEPEVIEM